MFPRESELRHTAPIIRGNRRRGALRGLNGCVLALGFEFARMRSYVLPRVHLGLDGIDVWAAAEGGAQFRGGEAFTTVEVALLRSVGQRVRRAT
jgi:hypothetical protein